MDMTEDGPSDDWESQSFKRNISMDCYLSTLERIFGTKLLEHILQRRFYENLSFAIGK